MCWNLESSLIGAFVSTLTAMFLISRNEKVYKIYGWSLLGITSMQWAESFLWGFGEVGSGTCTEFNRFGTRVLVPLAVYFQPMGPFMACYKYGSSKGLKSIGKYYASFCSLYTFLPLMDFLMSDGLNLWAKVTCTVKTDMGYLYWGAPATLMPLIVWWVLVATPIFLTFKAFKSLPLTLYGLLALVAAYLWTDSVGSNWCFHIVGYSAVGLLDYYFSKTPQKSLKCA